MNQGRMPAPRRPVRAYGVIVTLTEADLLVSSELVTVTLNVAGAGTEAGAWYVTDNPDPLMVPYVELPLVTPFTFQVTAVLEVPVTLATKDWVAPFTMLFVLVDGVVMATTTPAETVTLKVADLEASALLVATMLNVCVAGTDAGAL